MNRRRLLRVAVKFLILGLLLSPTIIDPEGTGNAVGEVIFPYFVAFVLLFMAFSFMPSFIKKPIVKSVKRGGKKMNLWGRFWRFMIR